MGAEGEWSSGVYDLKMYEAVCNHHSDVLTNGKKNKSEDDKEKERDAHHLVVAVAPPVYRNRSQGNTRRVTATNITAAAPSVERLLPNRDLYTQSFSGNVRHGSGKYLWKDGCMYEGERRHGKESGKGKYFWPSGATFECEFKSGRMAGVFSRANGNRCVGRYFQDLKKGVVSSRGIFSWANGNRCVGRYFQDLKKGVVSSRGIFSWANGNRCVGRYFQDLKKGVVSIRGIFSWANGNRCEGRYVEDLKKGVISSHSVFIWANGNHCEGQYVIDLKDGVVSGRGRLTWANGSRCEGQYIIDYGVVSGCGRLTWANGNCCEGQYVKDLKNGVIPKGHGVFSWPDNGVISVPSESCSFSISPKGRFKRNITCWEKGRFLGSGSFGSVYEGITHDGSFFALKEVSLLDQGNQGEKSIVHLEQEIHLLSQFEHKNIVQYYGTHKDESNIYLFLELVTNGSLLSLYKRYKLKDSQVSSYTRQILRGLKYLHDRNVVHRDIKCANILVDANGSVKLADFGLAKVTKLNDVKSFKGTAFWMAPEVVKNPENQGYGLPADIWSLGCTVLEMLTREIPYSSLEPQQALFKIMKGERPLVPDSLSNDARDFILRCLQVNPNDRPTAAELLHHSFVRRSLYTSLGSASPYHGRQN